MPPGTEDGLHLGARPSKRKTMFIDSHCHLNYPGLVEEQGDVVARALDAGVSQMISISTRQSEWGDVLATAERYPEVFATVGVHPHEADQHSDLDVARLIEAAAHPKVIGIGETGLDYYYDHSDRARQRASFLTHIAAARETGLPLVVHTRDAEEDTIRILAEEMEKGSFSMVIHCFTGSQTLAEHCLSLGAYISFSGILTFKSAKDLQETARQVPKERVLVETDSPFLAPVPVRGKTCEPAFVMHTARFLADLYGVSLEELGTITRDNTRKLFSKIA